MGVPPAFFMILDVFIALRGAVYMKKSCAVAQLTLLPVCEAIKRKRYLYEKEDYCR